MEPCRIETEKPEKKKVSVKTSGKTSPTQALRKKPSMRTGSDLSRTEKNAPNANNKKHETETGLRSKTKLKSNKGNNTHKE
jgi:hypothetical protein